VGANISILGSWIASHAVSGTSDWSPAGFYVQVHDSNGADVVLTCRLGFYSALSTGKAFFRDVKVTKVSAPAAGGDPAFSLEEDRQVAN